MNRGRLTILRVVALLGLAASIYLVRQHVNHETASGGAMLCSLVSGFDCGKTEESVFSAVFGMPTASFGVFYFLIALGVLMTARPEEVEPGTKSDMRSIIAGVTLVGLLTSISLALISGLVVGAFCLGCTSVYIVTLVNAAVAADRGVLNYLVDAMGAPGAALRILKAWLMPADEGAWEQRRGRKFLVAIIVLGAVNFTLPLYFLSRSATGPKYEEYVATDKVSLNLAPNALIHGAPDAPLQLVVFTDFECPACRKFNFWFKEVLKKFDGRYRLTYKHYPFGKECNPLPALQESTLDHKRACRMARLAQALGQMGVFWNLNSELYDAASQPDLATQIRGIAQRLNIDMGEWFSIADQPEIMERVQADIAEGIALNIESIPALYLNGRELKDLDQMSLDAMFTAVINRADGP